MAGINRPQEHREFSHQPAGLTLFNATLAIDFFWLTKLPSYPISADPVKNWDK